MNQTVSEIAPRIYNATEMTEFCAAVDDLTIADATTVEEAMVLLEASQAIIRTAQGFSKKERKHVKGLLITTDALVSKALATLYSFQQDVYAAHTIRESGNLS